MLQIISTYIGIVIMMLGVISFGYIVLDEKEKVSKTKLVATFLLVCVLHTIIYLNFTGTIKTLIIFVINLCLYKYIFKLTMNKAIFLEFLCIILLIIPDLLVLFFVTKILGINKIYFYTNCAGNILGNVTIGLLFILLTYIIRKALRKVINTNIENNTKIILFSFLILICTGMIFYTIIKEYKLSDDIILYLISILVLVAVLFSLIKQTIANNKLTEEYDKLLEYMESYEKEIEKQRILRHETKNEFLTIKGKLCDKQNTKEIVEYIDEILNDKIKVKQEEYAKFCYLPANGIKGLCYFKTQEAQDKGLKTRINISKRVENSNIYKLNVKEQRDLGKILGVFLDNAIEASTKSTAKEFGIEGYLNINKECELIITNSYDGEIALNKIGKERFSTKGKNRGHGLLLVKHLVSKNDKFDIKTEVINGLYIQTITIKKPIK